jgi:argininosuccinate lyase
MSQDKFVHSVLEIGNRIQAAPSQLLIDTVFAKELQQQLALVDDLSLVDLAYTLVSLENQLIPAAQGQELLAYLLQLQQTEFTPNAAAGDLYTNREAWLRERTASVAYLGVGRARREAITAAFLLYLRRLCSKLMQAFVNVGKALTDKAAKHLNDLMPDFTYLQIAQPTTFAHYLLGFAYPVIRDLQRLTELYQRLNLSVLGCGSSNGSQLILGRERIAELLGCQGVVVHARDAMWQADLPIELIALLTTSIINLSRLAEDLQIFCSEGFALVELSDTHARASKIMPQKKNPFALTAIRGLANEIIGIQTTIAILARTPSGQPDNRLTIYGLLPDALLQVCAASDLMTEVITESNYQTECGQQMIQHSWAMASDIAEFLVVHCGLDFRSAHKLLGYLARQLSTVQDLTLDTLQQASLELLKQPLTLTAEQFTEALNSQSAIHKRQEIGGAAPESVQTMLNELNKELNKFEKQAQTWRQHIVNTKHNLLQLTANKLKTD